MEMLAETSVFQKALKLNKDKDILTTILQFLDKIIKYDYPTKISVLLTGVSAYTPEPINLFIRGTSGSGKSHNATRVLQLFPKDDVWIVGKMSPTSLVHRKAELYTSDGTRVKDIPRPKKSEYENKEDYERAYQEYLKKLSEVYYQIDLKGKILLFLEAPHPETFRMLYPILSHDEKEIHYMITDRDKRGRLQTKHVVIKNWPACVFIRAKDEVVEEMSSRCFTTSPMEDRRKIEHVNALNADFAAYPWILEEVEEQRQVYRMWLDMLKHNLMQLQNILLPFENLEQFYPAEIVRDMRDFQHLLQFTKIITAIHYWHRPLIERNGKRYLLATEEDLKIAWGIFSEIFEITRTGLSQHIIDFYHKVVQTRENWSLEELTQQHNALYKPPRSEKTVRRYLSMLENVGYVSTTKDPEDNRKLMFIPLKKGEKETNEDIQRITLIFSSSLENNFKKWLEKCGQMSYFYHIINSRERYELQPTNVETLEKLCIHREKGVCPHFFKLFPVSIFQNNRIEAPTSEMSFNVHNNGEKNPKNSVYIAANRITSLTYPTEKCAKCGRTSVDWQCDKPDGSFDLLCNECFRKLKNWKERESV